MNHTTDDPGRFDERSEEVLEEEASRRCTPSQSRHDPGPRRNAEWRWRGSTLSTSTGHQVNFLWFPDLMYPNLVDYRDLVD